MAIINKIQARQILDSRGNPTVEVDLTLDDGSMGRASVPSGASTGSFEALELRDKDSHFIGKSVFNAVNNINSLISKRVVGDSFESYRDLDLSLIELDGSSNKKNLGANAILGVSLAFVHALSHYHKISVHELLLDSKPVMPVPMMNIINGGSHADNNIDIQEFMIIPSNAENFAQAMQWGTEIYHSLKKILQSKKYSTAVGDEGGFAPSLKSNEEALKLIIHAIKDSNLEPGTDIHIALDCAASEFFDGKKYILEDGNKNLSSQEFADYLYDLTQKYPIISIEDGMHENDISGWKILTEKLGSKCQLVGDDLFVTNEKILRNGIDQKIANSILIKYNQVGTITETMQTINCAGENKFKSIISHRSGETEDTTISDLSVGLGIGQIKTGAPCRSDRVAKYNRLLWIEQESNNILLK